MQIEQVECDVLLFRGDAYEGVATAFQRGDDVLLVDALASRSDAEWMRRHLADELGKVVRVIVATHYMSDHIAGLGLFPEAQIIAHRHFLHTFLSQRDRSLEDDEAFVRPHVLMGDRLTLQWGRHTLDLFNNPGKTLCTICIDAPSCDLVFASDNIVGNTAYLSSSAPELIDASIETLERLGRRRVVGGHIGLLPRAALGNARHYLRRLRALVVEARQRALGGDATLDIAIEDCVALGVEPTPFERDWHARNLAVERERRVFAL